MSEPPPSTQLSQEPPFFHHLDDQRIQVFVEAGGILNRPRLIRSLKKHDAVICSDPKNAQVILVDKDSWQGREFIREWGKDKNKVVLSYTWVAECLSARVPLLAEDDWGGCLTHDDGLPITRPTPVGDEGEAIPQTLPTPRETPAEIASTSASMSTSRKRKVSDLPPRPRSGHPPPSPINTVSTLSGKNGVKPPAHGIQPPLSQTQLDLTSPGLSPSTTDSMSVFAQQQYASMPFTMPNGAVPSFNMPLSMMSFPPQMLAMLAQQATGTSPITPQPPPPPPPSMVPQLQENFNAALMDIVRMYGAIPGGMPMSAWSGIPGTVPPQMSQPAPQSASASSGSVTAARDGSSAASGSRRDTESPSLPVPFPPPRSPSIVQPSVKRKRKSDATYDSVSEVELTSEEEEEENEPPLAILTRKKKKVEPKEKRKEKDERRSSRSGIQYIAPARNPHESPSQMPRLSTSDTIFAAADGKPMQFFVQVDLKDRLEVTRAVKKNGGVITSEITTADYAVLYSRSTTFKELLRNATISRTPAVTFHFVLDAINQGGLPDNLKNYLFDAKQNIKRKKNNDDPAEAEKRRLLKNAKQAEWVAAKKAKGCNYIARAGTPEILPPPPPGPPPPTRINRGTSATSKPASGKIASGATPKEKGKEKAVPGVKKPIARAAIPSSVPKPPSTAAEVKEKAAYRPTDRSPTPPSRTEKGVQGYLYTIEEKDWVEKYLFVLFKRDPGMSQTAVSKKLHRKLAHHSVGSWGTFLNGAFRSQFEEARKRGGIAHRKEKSLWEEKQIELKETQMKEREQADAAAEAEEKAQSMEGVEDTKGEMVNEDKGLSSPIRAPMEVDKPAQVTKSPLREAKKEVHGSKLTRDEEDDLGTVVEFFLNGGDDGSEPEEQVWARLGQQVQPKSAATWNAFYEQHYEEVTDRYSKSLENLNSA